MALRDYKPAGNTGQFTPLVEVYFDMDYLDRVLYFARTNFPRLDSLQVGMAVMVDDEFMQVTQIVPAQQGLPPGVRVKRGCADTVPARHKRLSLAWFIDVGVVGNDLVEYSAGDTTSVKYSPYTNSGKLNVNESGEIDSVTFNYRFYRPYAPGRLMVNDARWYIGGQTISADGDALKLTWTHRDRRIQADKLIDHDDPNIGPEPGTTYTVRVYDRNRVLKRTEVGIMANPRDLYGKLLDPHWEYYWQQAMSDIGFNGSLEDGQIIPGLMTIHSTRDGFDSWQGYEIAFNLNTQGVYIKVAQAGQISAQTDDIEQSSGPYPPVDSVMSASVGQISVQPANAEDYEEVIAADAMFVAALAEGAGQHTSFYSNLNRNLFEAPYAHLLRVGLPISGAHMVTVSARPGDRLTDSHTVWSRYDYPAGLGQSFTYGQRVAPQFTPWLTVAKDVGYLDSVIDIATSSFYDGIPLDGVQPGQVALIDAEVIVVIARTATTFTIARGAYDTVPAKHGAGARVWFFQAAAGNDPTTYPITVDPNTTLPGAAVQVKMIPDVYGPPLDLDQIPTDRLNMAFRVERPYPPGEVLVNGRAWYNGAVIAAGQDTVITWRHRNRDTQREVPYDHHAPSRAPEPGQRYRLKITITVRGSRPTDPPYDVTVRDEIVDGDSFQYSYTMAQTDGYRAGTLLNACGRVTVGLVLESVRDDYVSWQNYVIPLLLPSFTCPPGKPPGGGQLPGGGGNGNGDTGGDPGNPQPGNDNQGGGGAPGDNGGSDNGNGPPAPPEVPPDWPDPIDPPPGPDPDDPNPALAAHWDLNWDRHWDAYTRDNEGE